MVFTQNVFPEEFSFKSLGLKVTTPLISPTGFLPSFLFSPGIHYWMNQFSCNGIPEKNPGNLINKDFCVLLLPTPHSHFLSYFFSLFFLPFLLIYCQSLSVEIFLLPSWKRPHKLPWHVRDASRHVSSTRVGEEMPSPGRLQGRIRFQAAASLLPPAKRLQASVTLMHSTSPGRLLWCCFCPPAYRGLSFIFSSAVRLRETDRWHYRIREKQETSQFTEQRWRS